jgi:Fic family protein
MPDHCLRHSLPICGSNFSFFAIFFVVMDTFDLRGTPYLLDAVTASSVSAALSDVDQRVALLRSSGRLTSETLKLYYGQTRFDQIAESNAIEGSPLTVGETELAVTKGITISGHDPAFSRDAQALARALDRLSELARENVPTDIQQAKELNELILGDRPGAGAFRNEEVRIAGSVHRPPRNWKEIMSAMEEWQAWSVNNPSTPSILRAAVLHAWLVHGHPFLDGNGRTARAIGNLELIRAGYPPIIIRARKDRSRYIEALQRSDDGDLSLFLDLIIDRSRDALRDLERAAERGQGYSKERALVRKAQERQLAIWNAAVELLVEMLNARLHELLEPLDGAVSLQVYRGSLTLDEYLALCDRQSLPRSWTFRIDCHVPGLSSLSRLAWAGYNSHEMLCGLPRGSSAPSLFWSYPNPDRFPPWRRLAQGGPGGDELTFIKDQWYVRRDGSVRSYSPLELADAIAEDMARSIAK